MRQPGALKHEHITPILFTLQWLPVHFRIEYKLLVFVFKSFNALTPTYLDALVKRHTSARSLRSSDQQLLTIPRSRLKMITLFWLLLRNCTACITSTDVNNVHWTKFEIRAKDLTLKLFRKAKTHCKP